MKIFFAQRLGLPSMLLLFCCTALLAQEQNSYNHDQNQNNHFNYSNDFNYSNHRDPCKVFIGVGTSSVPGGLEVDYTVDNTPATTYGVKTGDVILALDGVPVSTYSELVNERNKHQQGEAFTLAILRDGSEMKINARFKECSEEELEQARQQKEERKMHKVVLMEHMKEMREIGDVFAKMERPILGVYEEEGTDAQGLLISEVIEGKGAAAAGLQVGDVITSVDGKAVTGTGGVRAALAGHQPGERVTVVYQRAGQTQQTEITLSADRSSYSFKTERDPCAVFIGVYTGDKGAGERGIQVSGIIDNTPAQQSGVLPGDVILSLDGQPVNTYGELLRERNKHQPGDAFWLMVLREGVYLNIEATFKACLTDKEPLKPMQEVVEVLAEKTPAAERKEPSNVETTLPLEVLEAYPNPTVGPLNVRFEAEAVPTTVRIMDMSGKVVYNKTLQQFNGYFNERLDLNGNTPGAYMLTIQQGEKVSAKKIVLMPRV